MLGKVIQGLVKSAIKNAVNFELAIDPLIAELEKACPPRETIDRILTQKNQLTQALTQTQTALTTITDTSSTIDDVLTGLQTAARAIKFLPAPIPPFTPALVVNTLSDSLDLLSTLIKEGKGTIGQVEPAVKIISDSITKIQDKLSQLDNLIAGCLIDETEGLTDDEKEEFFTNLGINLNTEDVDEGTLSANSNDPLTYKGFTITLDTNAGNKYSFPQRRAIAKNEKTGQKLVGPFSYSSSTQVLIDTIKFEIDKITKPTLAEATNNIAIAPAPADPTPPPAPSNPPSTSGTAGTSGTSGTSSSTPSSDYTPFDGPGTVNEEVRFKGGKYFRYLSQQKKWVDHYPSYEPFTRKGNYPGELNVKEIDATDPSSGLPVKHVDKYKWSQILFKWIFDSRTTTAGSSAGKGG